MALPPKTEFTFADLDGPDSEAAYEYFAALCRAILRRFIRRVFDQQELEDYVQQALLKAYCCTSLEVKNPDAYLVRICQNLVRDRADRRDYGKLESLDDVDPPARPPDHVELLNARRALARLTERCRQLLKLVGTGLSPKEVGEVVGISAVNARQRIFHCRKKLLEYAGVAR